MAYKQIKAFDQSKGGNIKGYCLQNVRLGFGVAAKYGNATEAWNNTIQHQSRSFPTGVAVPLFYSYTTKNGDEGHVNVHLPDGRVWSDGTVYASLETYESGHAPKFLGWGESLNGTRLVEYTENAAPAASKYALPAVGSRIKIAKGVTRTVFDDKGNTLGSIYAADETYTYVVRYTNGNRIGIQSAKFGRQVELALYYLTGNRIDGWSQV